MSSDDHSGNDQRQDRGDSDKPTRDARGRWLPGNCPNPKGRPKKKPTVLPDQSDIHIFHNTVIDVLTSGQTEMMDRRTALLSKMFESAMKGRVSMQRFLYKEFERNDERLAAAWVHYERLMFDWYVNNPAPGKPRVELPLEVELEIMQLRGLLNHYYPGSYPPNGIPGNDDDDDDDGWANLQLPQISSGELWRDSEGSSEKLLSVRIRIPGQNWPAPKNETRA